MVTKFECIGHVQKRMGTRLRKLGKEVKGLTKNGKLNDAMTDKLQNYYGNAIRENIGKDLPAMKKAVWAGGFHAASSVNNMWDDHCPIGKESWCAYQSDIANNFTTHPKLD